MTEIQMSEEFSKEYAEIQKRAERGQGEAIYILKLIEKGISKLINDCESGQKIKKSLFPKYYDKYDIKNLWRLYLDNSWRMIYTIQKEQVRLIAIILEALNHKDYNKRFGYK
jgi:mRNA-degrading endonuclease YafQ of YafQ-DinJ toxin-antitoxin module